MINAETPDRIAALGEIIANAGAEMEQLFRELSTEADAQMAVAAQAFLAEHGDTAKGPLWASYAEAHAGLLKATVAASNIREMSQRSTTLRSRSSWWAGLKGRGQQPSDIRRVCERAVPPARDSVATEPPIACDSDAIAGQSAETGNAARVPVASDSAAVQ